MVGGFELDERPLADRTAVDAGLQVEGRWRVGQKAGGEPAEIRLLGLPARRVPQVCRAGEGLATERDPYTPGEHLVAVDDWYLEQTFDEVMLRMDHALVCREQAVVGVGERRVPHSRGLGRVVHRQLRVVRAAARAGETEITGHDLEPSYCPWRARSTTQSAPTGPPYSVNTRHLPRTVTFRSRPRQLTHGGGTCPQAFRKLINWA